MLTCTFVRKPLSDVLLTGISAGHTVERAARYGDDLLALQGRDSPRSAHVVIRTVAQAVVITLTPARQHTVLDGNVASNTDSYQIIFFLTYGTTEPDSVHG